MSLVLCSQHAFKSLSVSTSDQAEFCSLAELLQARFFRHSRHSAVSMMILFYVTYHSSDSMHIFRHRSTCMQAETDYCHNVLENTEHLQEELYREMRGRIQEADQSAPVR